MQNDDLQRPDPEALLKLASKEEQLRGRLTIFFGAAPGVGKTYSMLQAAHQLKNQGIDVVVGYVETHKRAETTALLEGLEVLPPKSVPYEGLELPETNVEAIVKRKSQVVLIDELAHTNAPGSRHLKRYQDVEEILNIGIDVYTTLNVQHLESLNDVIREITSVRVRETVPDRFFDEADKVILVDLTHEELLQRLAEGKVYIKDMAERAIDQFFQPGNLMALRELALRKVATHVDRGMRDFLKASSRTAWEISPRFLVLLYPGQHVSQLLRSAALLAAQMKSEWIVLYIETSTHHKASEKEVAELQKAFDQARHLGAETAWIKGDHVIDEVLHYAQAHSITTVVMHPPQWMGISHREFERLLTYRKRLDVYLADVQYGRRIRKRAIQKLLPASKPLDLAGGTLLVALFTAIGLPLRNELSQSNLLMLMLLPVVISALILRPWTAIFTATFTILVFNFMFVKPYYTIRVADVEYFISYIMFVLITFSLSRLTAQLRAKVSLLNQSETLSTTLYELTRSLLIAQDEERVFQVVTHCLQRLFPCEIALLLPYKGNLEMQFQTVDFRPDTSEIGVAQWVFENNRIAGQGTTTLPESTARYFPIYTGSQMNGVLGVRMTKQDEGWTYENQAVIETITRLSALALERTKRQMRVGREDAVEGN